ncbi:MAG: triple tyrosine motif-containing protein [Luteibaculaceae bacterium]
MHYPKRTAVVLLLLFFAHLSVGFAAETNLGQPSIKNFNRSNYNAGTQNWQIVQDSLGLIYVGNNKGLLLYDGVDWDLIQLPNATIVRSVGIDKSGKIFLGGQNELGFLYKEKNGALQYKSLLEKIPEAFRSFDDVWRIFFTKESTVFCTEKSLFIFEENEFSIISPTKGIFENFFEIDGRILIQNQSEGLLELKNKDLVKTSNHELFKNERIIGFFSIAQKDYFIGQRSGIFNLQDTTVLKPLSVKEPWLKEDPYTVISSKSGNRVILGTAKNGLYILDSTLSSISHFNNETGLRNNTVLSVFEDKKGNFWLGLDNGIDFIEWQSPFRFIDATNSIYGTGYTAILFENYLYLGTNQGLFVSAQPYENDRPVQFKTVSGINGQVWNLQLINEKLIVSYHDGAAEIINKVAYPFSSIKGSWGFLSLSNKKGLILQGTYNGFYLYQMGSSGSLENPLFLEGFNESSRIFAEDEKGYIWMSHAYKGLYRLKIEKGALTEIRKFGQQDGLPSNLYITLSKIQEEIVFSTVSGIFSFNSETQTFIKHEKYEEIFGANRKINRILEDNLGDVWFSIDQEFGVLTVDRKGAFLSLRTKFFNSLQKDLVEGFEFIYRLPNHTALVGTEKGFSLVKLASERLESLQEKTILRRVSIASETGANTKLLDVINHESSGFVFKSHENNLIFSFALPLYEGTGSVQYRFKLEGFDADFSEWGSKTEKEYTNLEAGNYTFIVEAKDPYGNIGSPATFQFKIKSPWYLTVYAIFFYILAVIGFLIGFISVVVRREEKKTEAFKLEQKKRLEKKEAEFKKEVEKSEQEVNQLLNEKLKAEVSFKNSQLTSTTMHLVQKSEILQKLKTELTKLSKEVPTDYRRKIETLTRELDSDFKLDNSWEQFEQYFDQVQENFFKNLREKYPELTPKDQKLCAYLRMNLSTKEIAPLLNISVRGVEISRYRLRKKLNLDSDRNLVEFIMDV